MDYKKTIAALAVAATTAAMAEGIVSSSVVGYQNKGFENSGYSIVANTFLPVGGTAEGMTLGDIKVNDDFVASKLVFMTTGGANEKTTFKGKTVNKEYVYWFEEDEPEEGAGWYLNADGDGEVNCNSVSLPLGDGILVSRTGSEVDAQLVYAGEVYTQPVTKGFANSGYTPVGNCCPMTIKLGDITVNEDFVASKIVFMTTGGANEKTTFKGKTVNKEFVYWLEEDEPEEGAGWYLNADGDGETNYNDLIEFGAGEGFLVSRTGSEADATVTLPSAL